MALRPFGGHTAAFIDPVLLPGKESASNWERAISTIPYDTERRIYAIVVDNLSGMLRLARRRKWILQLCQFHLLLKLRVRVRTLAHSLRGGAARQEIYDLIRDTVETADERRVRSNLVRLAKLARTGAGTRQVKHTIGGLIRRVAHYRAYRHFPDYALPTTTNTIESMGRLIREVFRRNRAASNPTSTLLWAKAFVRLHPYVTCNTKKSTE